MKRFAKRPRERRAGLQQQMALARRDLLMLGRGIKPHDSDHAAIEEAVADAEVVTRAV